MGDRFLLERRDRSTQRGDRVFIGEERSRFWGREGDRATAFVDNEPGSAIVQQPRTT